MPVPSVDPAAARHRIYLYAHRFPAGAIGDFLLGGLWRGEGAAVIATSAHLDSVLARLRAAGFDADGAVREGRLLLLDAEECLAALSFAGSDEGLVAAIEALLAPISDQRLGPRCFGDMVDVLVRAGQPDRALRIERAWNVVIARSGVRLLCAYALDQLDHRDAHFDAICAAHDEVRLARGADENGQGGRLLDRLLQQDARQAAAAMAGQVDALHAVTAALAEARTVRDVASAVAGVLAGSLGASAGWLARARMGDRLEIIGGAPSGGGAGTALDANGDHPLAVALHTRQLAYSGEPAVAERCHRELGGDGQAQALLAVPLLASDRALGAMAFAFPGQQEFGLARGQLVEDFARQVAIALDRACLYEQACDANRRKDQFIAVLGHELRNPLAPIATALELMRLRGDTRLERERAIIERQVRHMNRLVDDLLDVSRVAQGKLELRKEVVELGDVVERALELASSLLEQRAHRLTLEVPRHGLPVEVDPVRFAQAVGNLLTNAAKYTDPGGSIAVACARAGDHIEIRIRDDGIGIPADLVPLLFEPFQQGESALYRHPGGLGLGLALVKSLVELHGGSVTATSDGPGHGSTFTITVPMAAGDDVAHAETRETVPASESPQRVLVVDDNRDAADGLAEVLRLLGHEVAIAYDGPAALEAAARFAFDAAVLDLDLPEIDGCELARRLRLLAGDRAVRFIAVTGYGAIDDRARTSAAGFCAHFTKPLDVDQLLRVFRREVGAV